MSNLPEEGESAGALIPYEEPQPPSTERSTIRRGSNRARAVRLALPLAAILVVAGVFYFASRSAIEAPKGLTIDGVVIGDGLEVTNPRFVGETEDGSPFLLTAKRARPDGPDPENIRLDEVSGDVSLEGGRKLNARAADGLFQPKKNALALSGDVKVSTDDGYTLSSEKMRFDLATRTGRTETPVRLEGPMGDMTAKSMEAHFEQDFVATFSGDVKIMIHRLAEPNDP